MLASCNSQPRPQRSPDCGSAGACSFCGGGCGGSSCSELNGELRDFITRLDETPIVYVKKPPKLLHDRYLVDDLLGEGSYGKVKLCVDRQTAQRLAVKIVTIRLVRKIPQGLETLEREAATMRQLRHRNTVRLHADFSDANRDKRYLVMEFAVCSIHDLQVKGMPMDADHFRCLPEPQARHYFIQLLDGVEYLHGLRIIHKDLKPGNLLLTADHVVKLADYGVCEQLSADAPDDTIFGTQATPAIQPPEVADGSKQFSGFRLDAYCAGVCLYFMVCGRVPYREKNVLLIYERIAEGRYTIEDWVSEPCQLLLRALMAYRAEERPDPTAARKFDWTLATAAAADVPGGDWVRLADVCEVESAEATVARVCREFDEQHQGGVGPQYETQGLSLTSGAAAASSGAHQHHQHHHHQPVNTDDEDDEAGIDFCAGGGGPASSSASDRSGAATSAAAAAAPAGSAEPASKSASSASAGKKKRRCCLS